MPPLTTADHELSCLKSELRSIATLLDDVLQRQSSLLARVEALQQDGPSSANADHRTSDAPFSSWTTAVKKGRRKTGLLYLPRSNRSHCLEWTSQPHFKSEEDCDAFGDRSTQRNATSESLGVDAPGSSLMSSHSEELKILSVYGKGEGPLATDGHDTLFTASEVESLNSLSADQSVAKSLERGERLFCREELSVQVGNHLLIHPPKERLPLLQL
ncbi:unnamed protein product [Arctogadus glacialis]